jgi:tetratricopeptide (TPR) repeat protein
MDLLFPTGAGGDQPRVDPLAFDWPHAQERDRSCYRGLTPLDDRDAGIFFGRDAALGAALDMLRGLKDRGGVFILLGGDGAGKTSFLCAGLAPRLAREGLAPLIVSRPGDGAFDRLASAIAARGATPVARIREAMDSGADALRPLLKELAATDGAPLVIAIDQAEDLFAGKHRDESKKLLSLLTSLVEGADPAVIVVYSIRARALENLQREAASPQAAVRLYALPAFSRDELRAIIEGPLQRLPAKGLRIEPELTNALLDDAEATAAPPLPLLAFALDQLLRLRRPDSALGLSDYEKIGRLAGCLDAAGDRVLGVGADGPPPDYEVRLSLLKRGLIPWLASCDAQDGAARRRVATEKEIPATSLPLIERLAQEGLVRRLTETAEPSFELVHDAVFSYWKLLRNLLGDAPKLGPAVERLKEASLKWDRNARAPERVAHSGAALEQAEQLYAQPDALALLDSTDRAYLVACRERENREKDKTPLVPKVEVEPRRRELVAERREGAARGGRLAWFGMVAALALAGFAGWKWQLLQQEQSAADARLAHAESAIEAAILSGNKILGELAQNLATATGAEARSMRDVATKLADQQERLADEPAVGARLRRTQSVGLNVVAGARLMNADHSRALAAAQKSVLLMQALTTSDASNVGWRRDLSVSYETLGDAQLAAKDTDGAIASYRYDLTIAKTLASAAPNNAQWRWDMSVSQEKLGDALLARGELQKALESYGESRTTREALLAAEPKNRKWERALARSYERIGAVLAQKHDSAGATAAFEGALEIYQRMARADPADEQTLLSSIVPRWRLAGLDRPRARALLAPALEILEKLAAEGRLAEDKREWLDRVKTELAALDPPSPPTQ